MGSSVGLAPDLGSDHELTCIGLHDVITEPASDPLLPSLSALPLLTRTLSLKKKDKTSHNASVNTWTQVFIGFMFSLLFGIYLGIAVSYGNFMFNTLRMTQLFSKWLHYFTLPSATYKSIEFSTGLPTFVMVCLYDCNNPSGCKVVLFCISLMTNNVESLMSLLIVGISLGECLFKYLLHF